MNTKEKLNMVFDIIRKYYYHKTPTLTAYSPKKQNRELVEIRHISYYLCLKYVNCTLQDLADMTNKKSHVTVIHGVKSISNLITSDIRLQKDIESIEELILKSEVNGKVIYLSGSISLNLERYGKEYTDALFLKAENEIKDNQDVVINPNRLFLKKEVETFTQLQFMERCIKYLFESNVIYMLKGYEESYNACIELEIAKNLNLKIIYQ